MKKAHASVSLVAVVLGSIALSFATTGRPASRVTAADLSRELSAAARSVGAGVVSERLSGLGGGAGSNSAITESAAVAMLQRAGYAATTSSPDRPLTRERADALVRQFRAWATGTVSKTGGTRGDGALPEDIDSCFDEANHGQCVNCCKSLGGGASTCAKACFEINKPSASEPIP